MTVIGCRFSARAVLEPHGSAAPAPCRLELAHENFAAWLRSCVEDKINRLIQRHQETGHAAAR